jgi:hypothetical protein
MSRASAMLSLFSSGGGSRSRAVAGEGGRCGAATTDKSATSWMGYCQIVGMSLEWAPIT